MKKQKSLSNKNNTVEVLFSLLLEFNDKFYKKKREVLSRLNNLNDEKRNTENRKAFTDNRKRN